MKEGKMAKAKKDEKEYTVERWTYAGRRLTTKGKIGYFWIDPDGTERGFAAVKGAAVGHVYEVRVYERDTEGGASSIGKSPTWTGDRHDDDQAVAGWELEDRAAYTADQARKAEQRAKREGGIDELTLAGLRHQLSIANPGQRAGMLAHVLKYLGV